MRLSDIATFTAKAAKLTERGGFAALDSALTHAPASTAGSTPRIAAIDQLLAQIDELTRDGREIKELLTSRQSMINTQLWARSKRLQPSHFDFAKLRKYRLEDASGLDQLEEAMTLLNQRELAGDQRVDIALDGVFLIAEARRIELLKRLKEANVAWREGFLGSAAQNIEAAFTEQRPMTVEVASFIGQPIVTAELPTGKLRVIPDKPIGDVAYIELKHAHEASTAFVAKNPGTTVIGIRGTNNRHQLLAATVDTSPRTVVRRNRSGQEEVLNPVKLSTSQHAVEFVTTSDGHIVWPIQKELWPEAYEPIISAKKLAAERYAEKNLCFESALWAHRGQQLRYLEDVSEKLDNLTSARQAIQGQKLLDVGEKFSKAILTDRPANVGNTNAFWRNEPLFHFKGETPESFWLQDDEVQKVRALPGHTHAEAAQFAAEIMEAPHPAFVTVVLRDAFDIPVIATVRRPPSSLKYQSIEVSDAVAAVIDHALGEVWTAKHGRQILVPDTSFTKPEFDFKKIFAEQFNGQIAIKPGRKKKNFDYFMGHEYYRSGFKLLTQSDPKLAAEEGYKFLMGKGGKRARKGYVMVSLGTRSNGERVFGLAATVTRDRGSNFQFLDYENLSRARYHDERIIAAINHSGITYLGES